MINFTYTDITLIFVSSRKPKVKLFFTQSKYKKWVFNKIFILKTVSKFFAFKFVQYNDKNNVLNCNVMIHFSILYRIKKPGRDRNVMVGGRNERCRNIE